MPCGGLISFCTCSLSANQRRAGHVVVQGDDLHSVFGAWLQAVDYSGLSVSSGGGAHLSFTLL